MSGVKGYYNNNMHSDHRRMLHGFPSIVVGILCPPSVTCDLLRRTGPISRPRPVILMPSLIKVKPLAAYQEKRIGAGLPPTK